MKLLKKKSRTKSRGKRTNYFPILCCVLFVALLLAYKALLPHKTVNQITATAEKLSDSLSSSEYTELKKEFKQIINEKNPTEAIEMLQEKIDIDPKIERSCHGLAHEIGRYAFAKYGFTEALIYQDDICGTGYIHGIIEAYFVKVDNPEEAVLAACSMGTLHDQIGKCRHGVGHGLMFYSKNDVTASLKNCDLFTDAPGRIQCAEGVFMENFNSDERFHTSKYLDTKNPFYPCDRQTNFYKDPCYFYAPDYYLILHDRDYKGAIELCKKNGWNHMCEVEKNHRQLFNIIKKKKLKIFTTRKRKWNLENITQEFEKLKKEGLSNGMIKRQHTNIYQTYIRLRKGK